MSFIMMPDWTVIVLDEHIVLFVCVCVFVCCKMCMWERESYVYEKLTGIITSARLWPRDESCSVLRCLCEISDFRVLFITKVLYSYGKKRNKNTLHFNESNKGPNGEDRSTPLQASTSDTFYVVHDTEMGQLNVCTLKNCIYIDVYIVTLSNVDLCNVKYAVFRKIWTSTII